MKRVLIVIMDMRIGGAQKSLQGFLEAFTRSPYQKQYEIDLMVVKPGGALLKELPTQINMVEPPKELRWLGVPLGWQLFSKFFSFRGFCGELFWLLRKSLKLFPQKLNKQQQLWKNWERFVPAFPQSYDTVVSYIDGFTNYYVMDKVQADKKILWIHNEYQSHGYDLSFDRSYYESCDGIITISDRCRQSILQVFPQYAEKTHVLENITSVYTVSRKSEEGTCPEFGQGNVLKLLSVGRLNHLKGFDLAIGAAERMKNLGVPFLWIVIGEGPERQNLQEQIEIASLQDCFCLIGARENPYPYMKACDVLVQTSRSEGKSIVLDEAKILYKPIVATNYATVSDAIRHGETGWVVDMTEEAICDGILRIYGDTGLRKSIYDNLNKLPKGNEAELERYIDIML